MVFGLFYVSMYHFQFLIKKPKNFIIFCLIHIDNNILDLFINFMLNLHLKLHTNYQSDREEDSTKSCKNNTKKINNQNSPTTIASYVDSINNSKMSLNSTRTSKSSTEIDYNSYYSKTFDDDQQQQRHSPSDDYLVTSGDIERFNKLKSEDLNIENDKWLEDKPISVLHLDQPDRAVLKIAGLF
jgi:hypothetical protein